MGAKYCDQRACLRVCLSSRLCKKTTCPKLIYILSVCAALSFSDNSAICYPLPVIWMTSCFHVMSQIQIQAWSLRRSDLFTVTSHQAAPPYCRICYRQLPCAWEGTLKYARSFQKVTYVPCVCSSRVVVWAGILTNATISDWGNSGRLPVPGPTGWTVAIPRTVCTSLENQTTRTDASWSTAIPPKKWKTKIAMITTDTSVKWPKVRLFYFMT